VALKDISEKTKTNTQLHLNPKSLQNYFFDGEADLNGFHDGTKENEMQKRGGGRNKKLVRVKWRGVCVIWGGGGHVFLGPRLTS